MLIRKETVYTVNLIMNPIAYILYALYLHSYFLLQLHRALLGRIELKIC